MSFFRCTFEKLFHSEVPEEMTEEKMRGSLSLTEVTLHSRTLVLLKLGHSITEQCYDQLLKQKRQRRKHFRKTAQQDHVVQTYGERDRGAIRISQWGVDLKTLLKHDYCDALTKKTPLLPRGIQ